jgi:hypothetical protein
MDWILLFVLVPLVIAAAVALCGFAGCYNPVDTPTALSLLNLRVTKVTRTSVTLAWDDPNPGPVDYLVERTPEGGEPEEIPAPDQPFTDPGLSEGQTYFYRARVDRDNSGVSLRIQVTTTTFEPAFTAALTISQADLQGFGFVQRIEPLRLFNSGNEVRITVRGSALADLTIDRLFISRVGTTGDPYDSAGDLIEVASNIVVPAGTAVTLPIAPYALDRTQPLLIAFDINPTPGRGNVIRLQPVAGTEGAAFFRAATAEADVPDRLPGYSPTDSFYVVERIEVA